MLPEASHPKAGQISLAKQVSLAGQIRSSVLLTYSPPLLPSF
jgi:hypothetical protein